MRLSSLLDKMDYENATGSIDKKIVSLAYDSRQVEPGTCFFAIPGYKVDGHDYIDEAISRGAIAVVSQKPIRELPSSVTQLHVADSREALAQAAVAFYDDPSAKMVLIGITGTNGKTTVSYLVERILVTAGFKTGLIGTIEYKIGGQSFIAGRTTPESLDLQRTLAAMSGVGVRAAVMEVSSHASRLKRVSGCRFDAMIFTNLTQDHLDFHEDMEDYFQAKAVLFSDSGLNAAAAVINIDDHYGRRLIESLPQSLSFGFSPEAQVKGSEMTEDKTGIKLKVAVGEDNLILKTGMRGLFNGSNILAAVAVARSLDISNKDISAGLTAMGNISGRFEPVETGQDFDVIVDYAHTPDGLRQVITAARTTTTGKVITVFGCGGDRDKSKRPQMGAAAAELSDLPIVTSDNPRSESPEDIINDILVGMRDIGKDPLVIVDRYQAISEAIARANKGDIVLIAGKGHESGQIFADRVVPFDDRLVAREILEGRVNDPAKSA